MTFFIKLFETLQAGGIIIYPLSILFIASLAVIIDKFLFYKKLAKFPKELESHDLEKTALKLNSQNIYVEFCNEIFANKTKPLWFIESKAQKKASLIEKKLNKTLWILETTITSAPLLGLLGTIIGMMKSFKLFGDNEISNISGITGGVAESLIATAVGISIALIALFFFNYFSKKQDEIMSELESISTEIIDKIRLEKDEN